MGRLLKVAAALFISVAAIAVSVAVLLPKERIASIAADQVKAATGRDVRLEGGLSPSFYPVLGVETGAISMANVEGGAAEHLLTASAVRIGIELLPLLSGEVRISEIRLVDPVIALEIDAEGVGNWTFGTGSGASSADNGAAGFVKSLTLHEAVIENGVVVFTDFRTGQRFEASELSAVASLPALDQEFTLEGDGRWNGETAALSLGVTSPAAAMAGEEITISASLRSEPAALDFAGRIELSSPTPAIDGEISAAASNVARAVNWIAAGPAPAAIADLGDASLDGEIRLNEDGVFVDMVGGAAKSGRAATFAIKVEGGADWLEARTLTIDAWLDAGPFAKAAYVGVIGFGGAMSATGDYSAALSDPAAAAEWFGAPAPAALKELSDLDLSGTIDASPARLRTNAKAGVTRGGERIDADLAAESDAGWMERRAAEVRLDASVGGFAALTYAGAVAAPAGAAPGVDGRLTIDAPDLRRLAAFAGAALPKSGKDAFASLTAEGAVKTIGADGVRFEAASIQFDDISASGVFEARLGPQIDVTANLRTGVLRIRRYLAVGAAPKGAGPGWSKERIDLSALGSATADVKLRADGVLLPSGLRLDATDVTATLRRGDLDVTMREIGVYGGGLSGRVFVRGGGATPAVDADVSAAAVRLLPMLKALADMTSLEGLGRVDIAVKGAGVSVHDIMNSLNGEGALTLSDGALVGYNLAAMARNITGAFTGASGGAQKTDFSEVAGTFTIKNGVLSNADFRFLGPLIRIVGEGVVDIGGQTVNFRLTPKAVASLTGQGGSTTDKGLSFPVIVSGPWSNLSFRPDLEAGLKSLLADPDGALKSLEDVVGTDGVRDVIEGATSGDAIQGAVGAAAAAVGAKAILDAAAPSGADESTRSVIEGLIGGQKKPEKATKKGKKKNATKNKRNKNKKKANKKRKKKQNSDYDPLKPEALLKSILND